MTRAGAIAALAAADPGRCFAWLDGGERSLVALDPDLEIVADDLAPLAVVEDLWRREPERVWIGWLTYELGARALLGRPPAPEPLPGLVLRRYPAALELGAQTLRLGDPERAAQLEARLAGLSELHPAGWPLGPLRAWWTPEHYKARVNEALGFIAAGDTYQINLTQAFAAEWSAAWRERPLAARAAGVYAALRARAPATMGALLAVEPGAPCPRWIVSNSPETLLRVELGAGRGGADLARSWPIKGTRPRGADPRRDDEARRELLQSDKDLAEHVMIVDLVRNDLGRLAIPGTVEAPRRPELMTLPTVHHLVSEVRCSLRPGWSLHELIAAMLPGGSVTGAPKRRSVELIEHLEGRSRGLYCGAIVALTPGEIRCSIPIRTGLLDAGGLALQSGGAIVIDSDPEAELRECWTKVRAFLPDADAALRSPTSAPAAAARAAADRG